ncbi:MAG: 4-hydroxythreonine-4-phosphate dehydrogenase PdxA [Myxococcales bacterium]|nr:4-hydroxythreonine-4-phosphate dehydrogenase PdxA [Myxococcales bacterium]
MSVLPPTSSTQDPDAPRSQGPHPGARRPPGVTRIGVTLGDAAGIGPEVLLQALGHTHLHERARVQVYVAAALEAWLRAVCARFGLPTGSVRPAAPGLHLIAVGERGPAPAPVPEAGHPTDASRAQAFAALDAMAAAARRGEIDAMVTGPVPKAIFDHLDPRPPGQTEYLAERLGAQRFAMMLAGPRLRVVPVTTHVPLRRVAELLTSDAIVAAGEAAADALVRWFAIAAPRLAVCGLNPHAGEGGRLGDEEATIIAPAVQRLRQLGIDARGPVVADAVFHQAMTGRYDAVLCMYHDQALGPLKTVHFHEAVNVTCGLPVPRLSPDHGTAYDIAGKGVADAGSMVQALVRAERMAQMQRGPDGAWTEM